MHSSCHVEDVQEITLNSIGPDTYAFLDSFIGLAGYQIFLNVQEIDANSVKSPIRFNRLSPLACEWRASEPYYRLIFTAKWGEIVGFRVVGSWHQWYVGISWVQAPPTNVSPLATAALSLTLSLWCSLSLYEIITATHNTEENTYTHPPVSDEF